MNDIAGFAAELGAQARRDEAAAFDRQYELARRSERAVAALAADGADRARQWADDDGRADADRRFEPEPEDAEAGPSPRPAAPRRVVGADAGGDDDRDDEEDDEPRSWLR